jgi:hypothetical protein
MTSKIKVDNIENQCGGAVVTKCGGTTTISGSVVKANAIQASDGGNLVSQSGTTITLGASGDTINLASGASQSGFGRTGTVDWDTTPKTATFSAVSGNGYFCNTTAGVITVNLPAGSAGAIVSLADYAATWQTNNLTVSPNGTDKIGGLNIDVTLNTEGQSVTLVYVDSTQGWVTTADSTENVRGNPFIIASGGTETTCGNCKIHTFTGPGCFTVTSSGSGDNSIVSYVVVAGGGGGGHDDGGGGGAGGFREVKNPLTPYTASPLDGYPSAPNRVTVTAAAFPITVGAGGAGGIPPSNGVNGSNSVFSTITSAGGGLGGRSVPTGGPGGSGGGGDAPNPGGTGNTPPTSPAQGQNGGTGGTGNAGGGGGGAGAVGGNGSGSAPTSSGGGGGNGVATSITGSPVTRGGGGGGGAFGLYGPGGSGGGGSGAQYPNTQATTGTANTGGGGGGGATSTGPRDGKNGGSGIVIIRYKFQ